MLNCDSFSIAAVFQFVARRVRNNLNSDTTVRFNYPITSSLADSRIWPSVGKNMELYIYIPTDHTPTKSGIKGFLSMCLS